MRFTKTIRHVLMSTVLALFLLPVTMTASGTWTVLPTTVPVNAQVQITFNSVTPVSTGQVSIHAQHPVSGVWTGIGGAASGQPNSIVSVVPVLYAFPTVGSWNLRAVDGGTSSSPILNTAIITVVPAQATAPGAISISSTTATSANITWGASPSVITGYQVQLFYGGLGGALFSTHTVTGLVGTFNNLVPNTTYGVSVVAVPSVGNPSDPVTATFATTAGAGSGPGNGPGGGPGTNPGPPPSNPVVGTLSGSLSVDNKGSANYSIPLSISPGRGGMQPSISLNYSSGVGNGVMGVGFSLSTGFPEAITRGRTILARDGITQGVTFSSSDKFYLDGKRLILTNPQLFAYGAPGSTYRTEVDSFVTVTTIADPNNPSNIGSFIVTDKSGTTMTFGKYGTTTDGHQMPIWADAATSLAYTYAIKHVEDSVGNCVDFTYSYTAEPIQGITYIRSEYVLTDISYTGRAGQVDSAKARVSFQYDLSVVAGNPAGSAARMDKRTEYIGGRRFEHFKRLDRIVAEFKSAASYETISQYDLTYEYALNFGPTRLKTVHAALQDPSSAAMRTLTPTTLTWSDSNIAYSFVSNNLYPEGAADYGFRQFADVNGDGKDDYIDAASSPSTVYVSLSNGSGFNAPTSWLSIPALWLGMSKNTLKICDLNGDGRKDIVYGNPLHPDVVYGSPQNPEYNNYTPSLYALISTGAEFVPLNGGTTPTPIFNFTNEFIDPPDWQNPTAIQGHEFQEILADSIDSFISLADYTGDGRDDILIHCFSGKVRLHTNTGSGFTYSGEYDVGAQAFAGYHQWTPGGSPQYMGFKVVNLYGVQMLPRDLNGDGRMDYTWIESKNEYKPDYIDEGGVTEGSFTYGTTVTTTHDNGDKTKLFIGVDVKTYNTVPSSAQNNQPAVYNGQRQARALISLPGGGFSAQGSIGGMAWVKASYGAESVRHRENAWGFLQGDVNGDGLDDFFEFMPGNMVSASNDYGAGFSGYMQKVLHPLLHFSVGGASQAGFYTPSSIPFPAQTYTGEPGEVLANPYVRIGNKVIRPWTDIITIGNWINDGYSGLANAASPAVLLSTSDLGINGNMRFMDLNGDGMQDYVWYDFTTPNPGWLVMYSLGETFSAPVSISLPFQASEQVPAGSQWYYKHGLQPLELNGDGIPDYAYGFHRTTNGPGVSGFYISSGTPGTRLTAVTDGLGRRTDIAYKPITDDSVYTPGAAVTYPIREVRIPQYVVSDVWHDSGTDVATDRSQFSYQYSGNRLDLSGRGSLGFHSFVTLDQQTNLFKYQFLVQSFPMTGLTARDETYRMTSANNFNIISSHDNTVVFDKVVKSPVDATAWGTLWPFISRAIEYRWEDGAKSFTVAANGTSSRPEELFGVKDRTGAHIIIQAESLFDKQTGVVTTLPAPANQLPYKPSDTDSSGTTNVNVVGGVKNSGELANVIAALPGNIVYGNLKRLFTDYTPDLPANQKYTETVETTYLEAVGALTGRVDKVSTTVTSPVGGTQYAPDKRYTYWGSTPLVEKEIIDADRNGTYTGTFDLTTTYTRDPGDPRGRVTATNVAGYNNPGPEGTNVVGSLTEANRLHIGSYTVSSVPNPASDFNNNFDLPTKIQNSYEHVTGTTYHAFLGLPVTVTDLTNSQVKSTTEYDALGRTVKVTDAFGLITESKYFTDNTVPVSAPSTYPLNTPDRDIGLNLTSAFRIVTTSTVQPTVTTYYDRLGRAIRTVKEGFSGQVYTDTVYNKLGQAVATTLPYPENGTKYWNYSSYDDLGRVQKITAANETKTENNYLARTTIVTVTPLVGTVQKNATFVDAKGRTVSVWNNDNISATNVLGATPSVAFSLDGFGQIRKTTLRDGSEITAEYDILGRQIALNDPDKGNWTYDNNALGQVVKQTDAKLNVTRSTFDRLARPLTRQTVSDVPTEIAGFYYYDTAASTSLHLVAKDTKGWIGAPARDEVNTSGAINLHYYDDKGRPSLEMAMTDGKWFNTQTTYDTYNRVSTVRHYWKPSGAELPSQQPYVWQDFGYTYAYDGTGSNSKSYLTKLTDSLGRSWWENPQYDHMDRVVGVKKGNNLVTTRTYRPQDGVLTAINTGSVQNLSFNFDDLGNLIYRSDGTSAEAFGYDSLNRLEKRGPSAGALTNYASYSLNGNITAKTNTIAAGYSTLGGAFSYVSTQPGDAAGKPHAVRSAWGFSMKYDSNGNLIERSGNGETSLVKWAGFDKPRWMARDKTGNDFTADTVGSEFHYNANRSRVVQLEFDQMSAGAPSRYVRKRLYALGSTLELNYTTAQPAASPAWTLDTVRIYVPGPDGIIGAREYRPASGGTEKALVYHYDHLGSITATTDYGATTIANDTGGKPGKFSEDAWGQRRNPFTWSGAPLTTGTNKSDDGSFDSLTPRGFTGHEMLDDLGLVHMNGRIYDPLLGRFLSADVLVDGTHSLQGYNRYSYVQNNPLSATDPSGHSMASSAAKTVWRKFRSSLNEIGINGKVAQVHHLIGREISSDPKLGKFLNEIGFVSDKMSNLMALPTKAGKEILESSAARAVHQGKHVGDYVNGVKSKLTALQEAYDKGEIAKEAVQQEISTIQRELRAGLKDGSIVLGKDNMDKLASGSIITVLGVSIASPATARAAEVDAKYDKIKQDREAEVAKMFEPAKAETQVGMVGKVIDFFTPVGDAEDLLNAAAELNEDSLREIEKTEDETTRKMLEQLHYDSMNTQSFL